MVGEGNSDIVITPARAAKSDPVVRLSQLSNDVKGLEFDNTRESVHLHWRVGDFNSPRMEAVTYPDRLRNANHSSLLEQGT